MRYGHAIISVVVLAAIVLGLTGCPAITGETKVTVTPPNAVVEAGQTIQLSAESSSPDDTDFTWESSDETVAVVEAVKSAAVVLRAVSPGTATITATADVSGATGTAVISVPEEAGEGEGEGEPEIPASKLAPGLNITIDSISIPADRRPVVQFVAKDDKGNLIGLPELTTVRFALAYLNNAPSPQYVNYVVNSSGQAGYDGAQFSGTTQNGDGSLTYKFKSALPADYSAAATHELGGQLQRLYVVDGLVYTANPLDTFRPDGQPVTVTREISATQVCNNCHTRLELHGGARREFQLCILCHTAQTIDPESGNTVDMAVMVHKIHMGENLPSVGDGDPYQIIGHGDEVIDFSKVVFPQDIRNCATCHQGAPQAGNYLTKPGQTACGSCHDRTWFGDPNATPPGYENHPLDFEQPDDSACKTCHKPTGPAVAPILEAHTPEVNYGPALALDITGVSAVPADEGTVAITIDFTAADGDGDSIADLEAYGARVGALLAYPAPEFQFQASENFVGTGDPPLAGYVNHGGGAYSYTLDTKAADNYGTYAVAMQGRVSFTFDGSPYRRGVLSNGYTEFTLDDSVLEPRRMVADNAACNKCHGEVRGHGGQRLGVEVCVMCHNTTLSEEGVSVNFKDMIHRIHTGEELNNPYFDFNEVRFPGKRQQCTICHVEERPDETATFSVPLPGEALPTVIDNETSVTEILPTRAACTSCHDSLVSDIHAVLMTDTEQGVETCAVCHGEGRGEDVQAVHQLNP
jgi:OmcA/MtrC family decaheme c-type cytochrome